MKTLYSEDLAALLSCGCGQPGCTDIGEYIHARCHIASGLDARYVDGILELSCRECKRPIINIAIAKKEGHAE